MFPDGWHHDDMSQQAKYSSLHQNRQIAAWNVQLRQLYTVRLRNAENLHHLQADS
jgi:hypothetical protein